MAILLEFVLGIMFVGLLIVALLTLLGIKLFKSGGGVRQTEEGQAEARMIQEMYQGMSRMEQRIETLETLLLDKESENREQSGEYKEGE